MLRTRVPQRVATIECGQLVQQEAAEEGHDCGEGDDHQLGEERTRLGAIARRKRARLPREQQEDDTPAPVDPDLQSRTPARA